MKTTARSLRRTITVVLAFAFVLLTATDAHAQCNVANIGNATLLS